MSFAESRATIYKVWVVAFARVFDNRVGGADGEVVITADNIVIEAVFGVEAVIASDEAVAGDGVGFGATDGLGGFGEDLDGAAGNFALCFAFGKFNFVVFDANGFEGADDNRVIFTFDLGLNKDIGDFDKENSGVIVGKLKIGKVSGERHIGDISSNFIQYTLPFVTHGFFDLSSFCISILYRTFPQFWG